MLIRRGGPDDLLEIAAIQAESPTAACWPVGDYLAYDLRVAMCDGHVAGFLASRAVAPDESEILNIAVASGYRRRGVAKTLIRELLDGFKGDLFLELRASNSSAMALYKSLGFKHVNSRPGYYESPPEQAVVMRLHSC